MATPAAEIVIDEPLIERLLRAQHPDLADLTLRFEASGWDNAIFRLGDDYAVRLPRRLLAAELVEKEHRWMPGLAARLTTPIPTPVRIGMPSREFPWSWSITPWFDGGVGQFDISGQLVGDLAQFVRELHVAAPTDAPRNPVRGGPLADRNETMLKRLQSEPIPRRAKFSNYGAQALPWNHGLGHPCGCTGTCTPQTS